MPAEPVYPRPKWPYLKEINVAGTVKETGGDFDYKLMPEGMHAAVCDQVVFLGKQLTGYADDKTGEPKVQEKVYLRFEVPKQRLEYTDKQGVAQNRPMTIGITVTASLSEKATLRKYLEAWRAKQFTDLELKGFDLFNVLGVPCMLTVQHNTKGDKTYANVTGINRFKAEMEVAGQKITIEEPKAENPLIKFKEGTDDPADAESFDKLQEWLQKKIQSQVREHPAVAGQAENGGTNFVGGDFVDDDIPF